MMPGRHTSPHAVPSDLSQLPIVWRYELLKYLRSWRLYASIAIVALVMSLLYLLPPLLGEPYSGTDTHRELWVTPVGDSADGPFTVYAISIINRSQIDVDSLVLYRDGTAYPFANGTHWVLSEVSYGSATVYTVMFTQDISGSTITATYDWYISPESFMTLFLSFASFLIIICATFFGADAIVSEFQNRTGYLVFPNPMKRSVLFLGKFLASFTAGLLVVTLFYIALIALSMVSARGIDDDTLLSFAYSAEFLLAAMAVAYLISSILKGSTGATVLTFFMFIMILPIIDSVGMFSDVKIEGSLTFSADVITYILIDPYPTDDVVEYGSFRLSSFYPDQVTAAVVMMAYALVSMGLGMFLFNRKQLSG